MSSSHGTYNILGRQDKTMNWINQGLQEFI